MLDKTIPYCNIIMKYDGPKITSEPNVDIDGYYFDTFKEKDITRWAEMEVDNNDFDTFENAVRYFNAKYCIEQDLLLERFIAIRDKYDMLVGSVICWNDVQGDTNVSTVHWLVTDPEIQGRGIGKALIRMLVYKFSTLNQLPIYLHTQPWSYKAVGIYSDCGFKLCKTDTFKEYINQSEVALSLLKIYMLEEKYNQLIHEMI